MKILFGVIVLISTSLVALTTAVDMCKPGEDYTSMEEPCKRCVCGSNGQPTDQCEPQCPVPECEPGTVLRKREGTFFEYDCVDPTKKAACRPGDSYIFPNNPCLWCGCAYEEETDTQQTYQCMLTVCPSVKCPADQTARRKPGTCCDYECHPKVCTPYETYAVLGEECKECSCGYDGEPSHHCRKISCEDLENNSGVYTVDHSVTVDAPMVDSDCSGLPCQTPLCEDDEVLRRIESEESCCAVYECVGNNPWTDINGSLSYVGILAIGLACILAVIVIGSIVALVYCYLPNKKDAVTDSRGEQYHDNLAFANNDQMKIIPENKVDDVVKVDGGVEVV